MTIELDQRPQIADQSTTATDELNFHFQVGREPFSISVRDLDLKNITIGDESAVALQPSVELVGVTVSPDLQGVWPYNSTLTVSPSESMTITVPASSVTISGNSVTSTEAINTIFPRGRISDPSGHVTLFDGAPARIETGTLVGTLVP